MTMSIRDNLRTYVLENCLFTQDGTRLNDSDSFLETGILDSVGILEIIMFLEEGFGVKVEDQEMVPENLDSINNLVAYVERKKASA